MSAPRPSLTPEGAVTLVRQHGGIRAASRHSEWSFGLIQKRYREAIDKGLAVALPAHRPLTREDQKHALNQEPQYRGRVKALATERRAVPKTGVKRYILTSAQNNTELHKPTWQSLKALAEHYGAEIIVSRFTYNKSAFKNPALAKPGTAAATDYDDLWYAPELLPHLGDRRMELAPGLVWCGEMNILPTAVRPLSGLEAYTGRRSGIFPHVKIAMQSVASNPNEATKFNYTTGTVTMRNYIQRKEGLKAEFHHCYGGLLVEVTPEGDWYVRQLNADSEGVIYDLTLQAKGGIVTDGHHVEAINWGDIHVAEIDKEAARLAWGKGGMLETLQPRHQFLHDVLDFRARSHHDRKDPHRLFQLHVTGEENVAQEVREVGGFLHVAADIGDVTTVVVDSNHHHHLGRWLKEEDARRDPVNAEFWFRVQAEVYRRLRAGEGPLYLREALQAIGWVHAPNILFLDEDASYVICPDANGGIQCGMHGDVGPGGSRGSPGALARMGRKANVGHSHSAGIHDGVYVAGTMSTLTPDWTRGPSSWSHSQIVTYPNGKRAIVTFWKGRWRA